MKYAANFYQGLDLSVFDEIIIAFQDQDDELPKFLEDHSQQTIVVSIENFYHFIEGRQWKLLNALYEQHKNFIVRFLTPQICSSLYDTQLRQCLQELTVPYFTGLIATDFEELQYLCDLKVKEVYIAESLGFDLRRVKRVCAEYGITIRAFPNIAQTRYPSLTPIKSFFIRPEDVGTYEEFIDTLEFSGPPDRQAILYRIYNKGRWVGDIGDLILNLKVSVASVNITPLFAQTRRTCARMCLAGDKCSVCERTLSIDSILKEKNLKLPDESSY